MKVGYEPQKWTAQSWFYFALCSSGMLFLLSVVIFAGVQSYHEFTKQQPAKQAQTQKTSTAL